MEYLLNTQIVGICFVDRIGCVLSTVKSGRSINVLIGSNLAATHELSVISKEEREITF